MSRVLLLLLAGALLVLPGCKFIQPPLPEDSPPLRDLEEPLPLFDEPDDEAARRLLASGVFTGVYVEAGGETLEALGEEGQGVKVARLVENSPGVAAGLQVGDVIFEVQRPGRDEPDLIDWPSQWRALELDAGPGEAWEIVLERAASERTTTLTPMPRLAPAEREGIERFREEQKVGVVVRTATEVEARAAGLGPGAGAVVVGLSKRSPWREAGLRYEDLLVKIDDAPVDHPQVVLEAIRGAPEDAKLSIVYHREGERLSVEASVSAREQDVTGVHVPLIFKSESGRDESEWSLLFGLLGHKNTRAAWEFRMLWFIRITGGDADELQEIKP